MCINISAAPRRNHEGRKCPRDLGKVTKGARVARQKWSSFPPYHFSDTMENFPSPNTECKENPAFLPSLSPKSRGILNSRRGSLIRITRCTLGCMACFSYFSRQTTARQSTIHSAANGSWQICWESRVRRHRKWIND
jgi:hypothetical protein